MFNKYIHKSGKSSTKRHRKLQVSDPKDFGCINCKEKQLPHNHAAVLKSWQLLNEQAEKVEAAQNRKIKKATNEFVRIEFRLNQIQTAAS